MSWRPDWEGILPRNIYIFLKEYRRSIWFTYSTPLSSLFWISSTIPSVVKIPYFGSAIPYALLVGAALTSLIAPVIIFWWKHKPFHVVLDWNPIEPESIDHRLEHKNLLRLRELEDKDDPVALAIINAYFAKTVDEYDLKLNTIGPLSVKPQFSPGNSTYKEEENQIICQNVESHDVFFPVEIIKDGDQQGVLDQELQIKDNSNGESMLMTIEVI